MIDQKIGNYSFDNARKWAKHNGGRLPTKDDLALLQTLDLEPNTVYWLDTPVEFMKRTQYVYIDGILQHLKPSLLASIIVL